ncbi:MAG: ABC transporter ATP-binding protein [Syntrophotalea acetylenica]|uniref:ABC transporter permease n=1 Tax=Syntrophotalea acetylenica TaxID=29542 RepID=A0A1L3GHS2_SYNAC|nr:ABC transporter ATP-binding protein [Syntrophotalea acetylenica]APG25492.1 ABC transporter permease [Syntrophotalea acetylenica]APG43557.1 ABC transporter permease [Syntrophotalea acetylenica]MDD4456582.1 ABC transporter ATP-binding protein [Syntrophotalea acetylenica]MDY0262063.1 ABC transporter ATP-binding protein [Syntrophotalea acetylenica]
MRYNPRLLYRRLYRYSKPYLFRILLAMAASLLVSGSDVATAKLVKPFVDDVLIASKSGLVNLVPIIVLGLALIKGAGRYIQEYFIKTAGQLVVQDIRNDLYRHSMNLSMGYFSRSSTGNVMSRILNDVGSLQRTAADVVVEGLRESFTLVGLTVVAFQSDWRLASIAFVVMPISIVPASVIGRRIKDNTRRGQGALGNLTRVLQESLAGIKVIKAFGTETRESERFRKENQRFYYFIRKVLKYDSAATPVVEILSSIGIGAVLWYGIQRVSQGAMTQGDLSSFLAAMLMMYAPLKRLTKVSNAVQRALGSAERVFELMDEKLDIVDREDALVAARPAGHIRFDHVGFSYGEEPVLHDFNLAIQAGEIVALVGPSGSGKSTIIGLLNRFYDPQQGRILIDGQDIRQLTQQSLKQSIALVDQETFLFNDTIRNNIRYGRPEATDGEVEKAASLAYADEFLSVMPEGYETVIGDRGVRLSGGQRQRICIARAILRDAPILLLDEATSALDTESEAMVQKALVNLMENRTTIVVAHRLSTVMHADKIVVLENGRICETGRHQDLLSGEGLYRRLYEMQFADRV